MSATPAPVAPQPIVNCPPAPACNCPACNPVVVAPAAPAAAPVQEHEEKSLFSKIYDWLTSTIGILFLLVVFLGGWYYLKYVRPGGAPNLPSIPGIPTPVGFPEPSAPPPF